MSDQNKSNSGSNHSINDGLNDTDIKQLFDQQHIEPPQALDEVILAAAKSSTKQLPEAKKPSQFTHKYTAAFGIAAMVLLGVVIVPLMVNQPEYTLDANNTSTDAPVVALLEQEKPAFADAEDAVGGGDAGNTMGDVSELVIASKSAQATPAKQALNSAEAQMESTTALLANEPIASKRMAAPPRALNSAVTLEERKTPQKWIEAIKRLYEQRDFPQAKAELDQFRQRYPDSEHEALLPTALREHSSAD